jgi:tetratricopeptide (TPR) repeat protein
LLNARHDYQEARLLLQRALGRQRSPGIVFELAVSQAGLGDRKAALRTLNSMPTPSGAEGLPWLRLLGALSIDEQRWAEGTRALEEAQRLAPGDPVVLYSLGLARLQSKRVADAVEMFDRSFVAMPPAQRHFKVGALLAQHGADAEAITEFHKAIQDDPQMYDAYFNLAVVCLRRKQIERAAQAVDQAMAIRQTGEAYNLMGDLREEQGRSQEALESLKQAVQMEPANEGYVFDYGLELIAHMNYDPATQVFRAAEERFPRSFTIALGLGAASYMAEKQDDAIRAFVAALKLNPEYEPTYTFLGKAYLTTFDPPDEVITDLGTVARTHLRSFAAQHYYGAALVKRMVRTGKKDAAEAALAALHRAARLQPNDAETYFYLGEVKRLQGDSNEACRLYEKAVALDPKFEEAFYKLGQVYSKMGRKDEATRAFARHHEVTAQEDQELTKREQEIKTFILTVRSQR